MVVMGGNTDSEQVNNVTALNGKGDRKDCFNCGQDDRFARDKIMFCKGVVNLTSVEKLVILKWCWRGTSQNFQQWVSMARVGKLSKR